MINLRFGARVLSLNPIVWRKAYCVYRYRNTFLPSVIKRYFMEDPFSVKGIFWRTSSEIQKNILAPNFYLNCFLPLFLYFIQLKNNVIIFVNTNTAVQSPFLYFEGLYLSKTLFLRGEASQLAVLTLINSPRTRLVALKYGSAWELVISVTLNSVWQTTANVCARL